MYEEKGDEGEEVRSYILEGLASRVYVIRVLGGCMFLRQDRS